ncbi:MAG TPA: hypothetical protein VEW28_01170 [Candidatus Kapabacteria bacterium]|nr:hypothetical protein [Candidatus Kapabacteria bacterium]
MASITVKQGSDPSGVPAAVITADGNQSFFITSWQTSGSNTIQPGGNVQLYCRKWPNMAAEQYLHSGWDGQTEIQLQPNGGQFGYGHPGTSWPNQNPPDPSKTAQFKLSTTQQWSIIPQTGGVGGAYPSSSNVSVSPSGPIPPGGTAQITFSNVNNGNGGTGNIIVTLQAGTLNR